MGFRDCRRWVNANLAISPQDRPCCDHHSWQICRKEGKYSPSSFTKRLSWAVGRLELELCKLRERIGRDGADGRTAGCDHPASRHRKQVTPIPSRLGCWYRALPFANHPSHVQDTPNEAQQGQAIHQGHQLQPLDAHTIHAWVGGIEGGCHRRYFQGGFPTGGREEDREEGIGGEIHIGQEQMVLHSS